MKRYIGEQEIRDMLACIPPCDREIWREAGMAIQHQLGPAGEGLFIEWSKGGESFNLADAKSVWKSFGERPAAIKIGTLVRLAKQNGYAEGKASPPRMVSKADAKRAEEERAEREQAAAEQLKVSHELVAREAADKWAAAAIDGTSAYLAMKQVAGHGVRYAEGAVLVPMVGADGGLRNIQRIYNTGDKRFQKGGPVSRCFHLIGQADDAKWLLIAEGYATAATIHETTQLPVAVAFNASNVKHVVAIMRERYPTSRLLICADDDKETAAKTGRNAGLAAAQAAANLVGCAWVAPTGLAEGASDFNDLALSAGPDEVRRQIQSAIESAAPAQTESGSAAASVIAKAAEKPAPHERRGKGGVEQAAKSPRQGGAFFNVATDGVWYHGLDQRGEPMNPVWICSELRITAHSRDAVNGDWGYLLEFSDADGTPKQWVMPATMLAGDGVQYRSTLLGMGLRISPSVVAKNQLTVYIQTERTDARVRCTSKTGWHDDVYVMPDRTIGTRLDGEMVVFQSARGAASQFRQRGSLFEWQTEVGRFCKGNTRLLFCVSAAFASTLLPIARVPSGGFHLWGDSSSGKSTAIKAAGSVFGGRDYPRNWRLTDNSLEAIATRYSDALLILDEIAQVDPKVVGDAVYMLANESGKGRLGQDASPRELASWRSMFLSDGEVDLATHMAAAGKGKKAGHDVRMAHIPADAGKGLGIYEALNGFDSGAALSDHLVNATQNYHGTAGIAFIEYAVSNAADWSEQLPASVTELATEMCPQDSHGQVSRVATRFALVGMAGELATGAGITGWVPGEASDAARACFAAWLSGRGGAGNVEHTTILRQVSGFFQLHGSSRFVSWHRATDDHAPNVINRAGYRRMITGEGNAISTHAEHHANYGDRIHPIDAEKAEYEYFMFPDVFRNEVCKGFDPKLVSRLLIDRGLLEPEPGPKGGATRKERLPGAGLVRCYRFKPGIIAVEV